jgi:hypothetical protein
MLMRAAVLVMLSPALVSCGKSHPATESRRSQHLGWVDAARLARTETEPLEWVAPGRDCAFLVEQEWKAFEGDTAEIMKTH